MDLKMRSQKNIKTTPHCNDLPSSMATTACECAVPGATWSLQKFVSNVWTRAVDTAPMDMVADALPEQLTLALAFTLPVTCDLRVCVPLSVTMTNDTEDYPATLSLVIKVINVLPPARVVSSAVPTQLHLDNGETDCATLTATLTLVAGTYTVHVACAATATCSVAARGNISVAACCV